jgi:chromosome segregation ATPase
MWAFLSFIFTRLLDQADGKLATIQQTTETIMSKQQEIMDEIAKINADLAEVQGDLDEVIALNKSQADNISALMVAIQDLQAQLDPVAFDNILTAVKQVEATTRQIADVVPEPTPPNPPAL